MKRSKFTDEQILKIVREGEAGRKVADLCRTNGITEPTYYRWRAKYGGMELSEMHPRFSLGSAGNMSSFVRPNGKDTIRYEDSTPFAKSSAEKIRGHGRLIRWKRRGTTTAAGRGNVLSLTRRISTATAMCWLGFAGGALAQGPPSSGGNAVPPVTPAVSPVKFVQFF